MLVLHVSDKTEVKETTMGLKEIRKSRGLTQTQLAKASGLNPVQIARWESGAKPIENMTLRNAIRLGDALQVDQLRDLLD